MAPAPTPSAGPLLIGFLLNTGLFGILSIQTYEYYLSFPNDKLHLKFLIYGVFLAEITQTALTICDAYWIFVIGFGDPSVLMSAGRMFWVYSPLMGGIVVIATHMYSAHRISLLYNSRTPGFIVAAISVAEFAAGLVSAIHLREQAIHGSRPDIHFISILIWTPLCVLGNIAITILMTFWFLRWGSVGSKTTQTIVAGLLRLTIETGVILALTIIGLTLLFNHPEQPYFITFAIAISKCHSVTWLALLNNRTSARRLEDNLPVTDIQFQAVSAGVRTDSTVPVIKFNHSFARPGVR